MEKKLLAAYVRQLKKQGWRGNHGGWVYHQGSGFVVRRQGWYAVIKLVALSLDKFGRGLEVR